MGRNPPAASGNAPLRTHDPALDTTLVLETPEHVTFRYQLAGPGQRFAAYLVDFAIRGLILGVAVLLVALAGGSFFADLWGLELGILLLLFFVVEWGYFLFFEGLCRGASPGKRALRLRVIRQDGLPVSFGDSLLRNLLRAADLLPTFYVVGVVTMCLDDKFRRLGDLVARTIVVCEPRATGLGPSVGREPAGLARRSPPTPLPLPARPTLSRRERAALALFHRRAPELSVARARELAEIWAPTLRARFGVPDADALALLETLNERIVES